MRKSGMKAVTMMLAMSMLLPGCSRPEEKKETTVAQLKEKVMGESGGEQDLTIDKPITVTVPFKVGSATDVRARIVMEYASKTLGQIVTIYNAPGAAGMIGITEMMGKNSKNYELSYCGTSVFTAIPLFNQTTYTWDDIIPLISTDKEQFGMFACPEKSGISSFEDVKNYNGRIKYATGAPGSMGHIMCATSVLLLGIEADHIVTDGASVNLSECLGGSNDLAFAGLGLAEDYVKEGKLVPIYTFNEEDYDEYKGYQMPSLKSLGINFSHESLLFFGARNDTPDEIVNKITKALEIALDNEECKRRLIDAGAMEVEALGAEEIKKIAVKEQEDFKLYGPKIGLTLIQ